MKRVLERWALLRRQLRGTAIVEYGLIAALILLALVIALTQASSGMPGRTPSGSQRPAQNL